MRGCWGESKGGNTDENTVYSERQTVYTHIGIMIKYQNTHILSIIITELNIGLL